MSSANIILSEIPASIDKPGIYGEINRAAGTPSLPANEETLVLIAQRIKTPSAHATTTAYILNDVVRPSTANGHYYICVVAGTSGGSAPTWPTTAAATVADGTATWMEFVNAPTLAELTATRVYTSGEALAYCGAGSMAHLMVAAAIKANKYVNLSLCTVEDASSAVKATGTFTFTGAPTVTGTAVARIGNTRIPVALNATDHTTATLVATAVKDSINNVNAYLPVVARSLAGVLTLVAKNGGTQGNQVYINCEITNATGLSVAVVAMASGANDPDISAASGVLDKLEPTDYTMYVSGLNDATSLGHIKTQIDTVSNGLEKRPALCVFGYTQLTGVIASVKTLCGTTLNHWRTVCGYLRGTRSISYEIAAALASLLASKPAPNAGYDDDSLVGIHAPAGSDRFTNTEIEDLLDYGVTPLYVAPGGGELVAVCRMITTYTRDTSGVIDRRFRDVRKPRCVDYFRKACIARCALRFKNQVITTDIMNLIKSELQDVAERCGALHYLENVELYKDYLLVEVDSENDTRVVVRVPTDTPEGLHQIAMRFDLL